MIAVLYCTLQVFKLTKANFKAQVSFSDQDDPLSVVVVIFSHFYLLLQNHTATSTKLGTNHLRRKCFKFVPVKDQVLFKGEIIANY